MQSEEQILLQSVLGLPKNEVYCLDCNFVGKGKGKNEKGKGKMEKEKGGELNSHSLV